MQDEAGEEPMAEPREALGDLPHGVGISGGRAPSCSTNATWMILGLTHSYLTGHQIASILIRKDHQKVRLTTVKLVVTEAEDNIEAF